MSMWLAFGVGAAAKSITQPTASVDWSLAWFPNCSTAPGPAGLPVAPQVVVAEAGMAKIRNTPAVATATAHKIEPNLGRRITNVPLKVCSTLTAQLAAAGPSVKPLPDARRCWAPALV